MRIDAHQHFWIFDPVRDAWITEKMSAIRRNFLPTDLSFALKENRIDGVIAVQADQSTDETQFLVDLSTMYAMIKGVVGWVDLRSPQVAEQLAYFSQYKIIKGYRHIIEAEADADFFNATVLLKWNQAIDRIQLYLRFVNCASTLREYTGLCRGQSKSTVCFGSYGEAKYQR